MKYAYLCQSLNFPGKEAVIHSPKNRNDAIHFLQVQTHLTSEDKIKKK